MTIPLRGPCNAAVRPTTSTLRSALAAAQFAPIMKISDASGAGIAAFQDAIRAKYPIVRFETESALQIEFDNGKIRPTLQDLVVWRFLDTEEKWRVSLTRETISVDTRTGYSGRADFVARAHEVLSALSEHFQPGFYSRVGVRFLNAAGGRSWERLAPKCPSEVVGLAAHDDLKMAQSVWRLGIDEGELILRSGVLPKDATHDPAIMDAVSERTWYLDVDVFSEANIPSEAGGLSEIVAGLTERARMIFGWAVGVG